MNTVQDIFLRFFSAFLRMYKISGFQYKVAFAIMNCRTAVMGGRMFECEDCGYRKVTFNSCRNRHCPSCQSIPKEKWIDARKKDLLPAPYFHVVFTVPEELRMLIYQNKKILYDLLYKSVSETLTELAGNPKYLGAQIGYTSILHTWGQDLIYHPHIHTIVLAGGLTPDGKWKTTGDKFFIPVEVLSRKFGKKFLYYLKSLYYENKLKFHGGLKELENPSIFQSLLHSCYEKSWYTYSKETFSGPLAVIKYLGRYTHRVAISNNRIVSIDEETVTFKVKDYKDNSKEKLLTLTGVEFIRRFMMHVLPKRFVKIRHYGILATRNKSTKLAICRKIIKSIRIKSEFEGMTAVEIIIRVTGKDITKCPACKGTLKEKMVLKPKVASP